MLTDKHIHIAAKLQRGDLLTIAGISPYGIEYVRRWSSDPSKVSDNARAIFDMTAAAIIDKRAKELDNNISHEVGS